jgi:DNA-binding GntR family transcriptional regulator
MKPKYMIVIEEVEKIIDSQEINSLIPSERVLSEQLDISRMTVRKAIQILVNKGKLYRVNNVGTFISDEKLYKVVNTLVGFTNEVNVTGSIVENEILEYSFVPAKETVSAKLQIIEGSMVHKVVRVRKRDGVPIMIDTSYFPADIIDLDIDIIRGSIYNHITNTLGLSISSAIQEIKAAFIPDRFKGILNIKDNEPTIFVDLVGYLENGRIYEYATSYKDQNRYELVIQSIR